MHKIKKIAVTVIQMLMGCAAVYSAQQAGIWVNITPPTMKMSGDYINGPISINTDPARPTDMYVQVQQDGCWKSTDYGATWIKVSIGVGASDMNSGRQWYQAIDMNPNRNPATPPTLYSIEGYGSGGVWKSTNGGVDWVQVWKDNFYQADGVTKIAANLVGNDISGVMTCDSIGPNNLLVFPHGNIDASANGVYSSTDGGAKWILHKADVFGFAPHADVAFPVDASTWIVSHGGSYPFSDFYRTSNAGATWTKCADSVSGGSVGRAFCLIGSTIYAGADFSGCLSKSTDKGVTWTNIFGDRWASQISWVVPTATTVYMSDGRTNPHIRHASLTNDKVWIDDGNPSGMTSGGSRAAVTFDGTNYIIVAGQEMGGLWRFVEPAVSSAISPRGNAADYSLSNNMKTELRISGSRIDINTPANQSWQLRLFTFNGELIAKYSGSGQTRISQIVPHAKNTSMIARLQTQSGESVQALAGLGR
jgi:hypothetical protein